ncbi:flavin reductase family protein [Erythrobacter sp. NAP1]|uniref:flavin reductase family protein n=1 Tax=Erythrobacter sp. NAP1 TaxID=237727 RepID=UPI00138A59FE|nr:flavin reductase family protein [Erythrobacter sp. NAP1]
MRDPAAHRDTHAQDTGQASLPSTSEFRKLMGQFATGVCVVAVETESGGVAAMTINSLVSVSLEPMLLCWSLHNSSSQFDLFAKAERFTISILSEDQAEVALRYAARGDSRLVADDFATSSTGLPSIIGSVGHFECRQYSSHTAGDHTMLLGEVTAMSPLPATEGEEEAGVSPLGFFKGRFFSIGNE